MPGARSRLTFFKVMAFIVGVGLLVLVIVLAFGNRAAPESDVPTVPISGMQNPAGTDTGAANEGAGDATAPTQQPVAPTSATMSGQRH